MLLRYHWGLGVRHTYSHVASPSDENQPFNATENHPAVQGMSPSSMPVLSPSQNQVGSIATSMFEDDPDAEFVLPQWDGLELEWEVADSEEEDSDLGDDIQTMYMLYNDGVDSDN